jgi:hypothetical protein
MDLEFDVNNDGGGDDDAIGSLLPPSTSGVLAAKDRREFLAVRRWVRQRGTNIIPRQANSIAQLRANEVKSGVPMSRKSAQSQPQWWTTGKRAW